MANHVPLARILRDSALELLLTFCMLFGVASIVRWVIGPSPISRMLPEIHVELLIVGLAVAVLIAGLILSPPGKETGGHMNPAISFAMWRFGVFPGTGVVPYAVAQLVGSVLGVVVARIVWGPVVAEPPVAYAVLQPGPGWSDVELFIAEALSMAVIVLLVGICLTRPRMAPFVPLDRRRLDRVSNRRAWHLYGRRCKSSPPVRAGCSFGTDSVPLGLSGRANGRCDARDMGQKDSPAPPICAHTQTMRHSPRRQLVVKLKDGCVAILQRDGRLYKASGVLQQRLSL